jgi:hypothetical protein
VTDVIHSLGVEGGLELGSVELVGRVRGSYELNRHLGGDALNLTGGVGVRLGL